jgi:hypothetical protein
VICGQRVAAKYFQLAGTNIGRAKEQFDGRLFAEAPKINNLFKQVFQRIYVERIDKETKTDKAYL